MSFVQTFLLFLIFSPQFSINPSTFIAANHSRCFPLFQTSSCHSTNFVYNKRILSVFLCLLKPITDIGTFSHSFKTVVSQQVWSCTASLAIKLEFRDRIMIRDVSYFSNHTAAVLLTLLVSLLL